MSKSTLEIKELGFVLIGKFNPVIFHPQWLARKELISEGVAETANLKINHSEVSEFDLEYCTIQVFPDRFTATSRQETHFKAMRDLVSNIFACLPETHVIQVGINLHHHYKFDKEAYYVEFGHKIIPKEVLWKKYLKNPGLSRIHVIGEREDDLKGKKNIMLGVSDRIPRWGIEIQVNDHFDLYNSEEIDSRSSIDATRAITILNEQYDNSFDSSGVIITGIYKHGIAS